MSTSLSKLFLDVARKSLHENVTQELLNKIGSVQSMVGSQLLKVITKGNYLISYICIIFICRLYFESMNKFKHGLSNVIGLLILRI